jgi:hypothetical protein
LADPSSWTLDCIGDFEGNETADVLLQSNATGWVGAWIVAHGAYSSVVGIGQV